jgi:hypothetical protein
MRLLLRHILNLSSTTPSTRGPAPATAGVGRTTASVSTALRVYSDIESHGFCHKRVHVELFSHYAQTAPNLSPGGKNTKLRIPLTQRTSIAPRDRRTTQPRVALSARRWQLKPRQPRSFQSLCVRRGSGSEPRTRPHGFPRDWGCNATGVTRFQNLLHTRKGFQSSRNRTG